jgi:hypothetical protein
MFAARAGLAVVLPGYDADDVRRFRAHARASLHPKAGAGIEEP